MTHKVHDWTFETEAEALGYMERRRANKSPIEDLYLSGPFHRTGESVWPSDRYKGQFYDDVRATTKEAWCVREEYYR